MGKQRAPYPAEFRAQMVALVKAGHRPQALAREFGPTAQSIHNWVRQADRDSAHGRQTALSAAERQELSRLRRQLRERETERDVLGPKTQAAPPPETES